MSRPARLSLTIGLATALLGSGCASAPPGYLRDQSFEGVPAGTVARSLFAALGPQYVEAMEIWRGGYADDKIIVLLKRPGGWDRGFCLVETLEVAIPGRGLIKRGAKQSRRVGDLHSVKRYVPLGPFAGSADPDEAQRQGMARCAALATSKQSFSSAVETETLTAAFSALERAISTARAGSPLPEARCGTSEWGAACNDPGAILARLDLKAVEDVIGCDDKLYLKQDEADAGEGSGCVRLINVASGEQAWIVTVQTVSDAYRITIQPYGRNVLT